LDCIHQDMMLTLIDAEKRRYRSAKYSYDELILVRLLKREIVGTKESKVVNPVGKSDGRI